MGKFTRRYMIASFLVFIFVTFIRGAVSLINAYPWTADVMFWAVIIAVVTKLVYIFLDS